ncbi:MAG TPA: hypothetical protein VKU77_04830 [Streptosporangiaceae bacterium]|nr:hypothetical protein [Streptosporangiaceae bacterium]
MRHRLTSLLVAALAAVAAVLAGATSTLRNLATGILKTAGHASIAAACRHHARDATGTLETPGPGPA